MKGVEWGGGILYVLFVLSLSRNVSVLLIVVSLFFPFPFLFGVFDRARSADMARSTNKQTEGIKIEKNRVDGTWRCVFIAVSLMACSSHYSLLCPLPPIGCNNTAWHGCQCHIISYFCLTTWTTRATSHQDQFTVSYYSGSCVCSR